VRTPSSFRHSAAARSGAAFVAASVLAVVISMTTSALAGPPSTIVTVDKHIPYVTGGTPNQTLDIYRQDGPAEGRPVLVTVHGGGFAGGSPDDLSREARLAAEQGWVTFNLDYRATIQLGTEGQAWPAEVDDVKAGVRWVRDHATEFGADPNQLAMLGGSAGGTLAGLAAADPTLRVRALALWSAPTELATLVPDALGVPPACGSNTQCLEFWRNPWVTNLFGCTPDVCPAEYEDASLVNHAEALPATFIANATEEIVPLDQAHRLDSAVRAASTTTELQVVPGALHAQTYTESVWNDTMPFLAKSLGAPAPDAIDFADSPLDLGWGTVAILVAVIGIVVAVVARIASDRSRGRVL
jgi:acetyl esterase/lipase